jgi:hypothetical protein
MSADQVSERARFAAREFVARWYRETGEEPLARITDRMLFAYEMGFLRGRSDGMHRATELLNDLAQARAACVEGEEEDK